MVVTNCWCSSSWLPLSLRLPWNLKAARMPLSLKLKCEAFSEGSGCLVHNDQADLQALLQILPSDLHQTLLDQTNRSQLLEVTFQCQRYLFNP